MFLLLENYVMTRRSQIQKQVLILYRNLLRMANSRPGMKSHIRAEFQRHKEIPKTNIMQIEYLLRLGNKRLAELKNGSIVSIGTFV